MEMVSRKADTKRATTNSKKKHKLFLQSAISSSSCTGPELYYFWNCDFYSVECNCSAHNATIAELLQESFQFIMPDGMPQYFKHFPSCDNSWKTISALMYKEFSKKEIIKWQMLHHKLDYTNASATDLIQQKEQLRGALNFNHLSDNEDEIEIYKQSKLHLTGLAMLELHSLLSLLKHDTFVSELSSEKDNSKRHDHVKGVMYGLFNLWDLGCRVNGHAKFVFPLPKIGRLSTDLTSFTTKPDAVLYALETGKISHLDSQYGVDYNMYPYLVMEVYGPCKDDVIDDDNSTSQTTSDDSDSDESINDVAPKFKRMIASHERTTQKLRNRIENLEDFYEDEHRQTRKAIRTIIAEESPFPKGMQLALKKSTGQLPVEMYGSLVEKMMLKNTLSALPISGKSQALGIFVMNEKIYFEKMIQSNHVGKSILEKTFRPGTLYPRENEGPAIHLAQWCLDLKIPNHRIAFQGVLYYLQKITFAELIYMQQH